MSPPPGKFAFGAASTFHITTNRTKTEQNQLKRTKYAYQTDSRPRQAQYLGANSLA
ncbi:hypothetical protein GCM10027567_08490 [Spongiibacter taiwanensis]